MSTYVNRVAISFSILLNSILGGKHNQTLSATQYNRKREGKFNICWLIDKIFFLEKDHCQESWIKWIIIHEAINKYDEIGK